MRAILLSLLFVGCSIPDPTQIPIRCGDGNPCPSGQSCGPEGLCFTPASDMAGSEVADMPIAAGDGSMSMDQAKPSGCAKGTAYDLGKAWACQSDYNKATSAASSLCASGFHVCKDATDIGATSLAKCATTSGFYAAAVIGSRNEFGTPGQAVCGQGELYKVIFGCGMGGLAISTTCSGLNRGIDCGSNANYSCAATLDATDNRVKGDGVLCCPN